MQINEEFQLWVLEGKDKGDDKKFETTAWIFHEGEDADRAAIELINDGTFKEVRIRIYCPEQEDEGIVVKDE